MEQETLKLFISAFCGGIIAAVITHALAIRRERSRDSEQRKREFRGFLAELRSRIERFSGEPKSDEIHKLWLGYIELVHRFHSESAKVRGDFQPREEFISLCDAFGSLKHENITKCPADKVSRDIFAEAIDALKAFTKEK